MCVCGCVRACVCVREGSAKILGGVVAVILSDCFLSLVIKCCLCALIAPSCPNDGRHWFIFLFVLIIRHRLIIIMIIIAVILVWDKSCVFVCFDGWQDKENEVRNDFLLLRKLSHVSTGLKSLSAITE